MFAPISSSSSTVSGLVPLLAGNSSVLPLGRQQSVAQAGYLSMVALSELGRGGKGLQQLWYTAEDIGTGLAHLVPLAMSGLFLTGAVGVDLVTTPIKAPLAAMALMVLQADDAMAILIPFATRATWQLVRRELNAIATLFRDPRALVEAIDDAPQYIIDKAKDYTDTLKGWQAFRRLDRLARRGDTESSDLLRTAMGRYQEGARSLAWLGRYTCLDLEPHRVRRLIHGVATPSRLVDVLTLGLLGRYQRARAARFQRIIDRYGD